jgi:hypothetical protein
MRAIGNTLGLMLGSIFMRAAPIYLLALLSVFSLLSANAFASGKTDVIYLKNGDRITGEIKELSYGELRLSTNEMGSIEIKWEGIARIESDHFIQIELRDGTRVFGQLPPNLNTNDNFLIFKTLKGEPFTVAMDEVVRAEQINVRDPFLSRLNGNLKVGLNYTKSSDILTWNLNGDVKYRTQKRLTSLAFNSTLTRNGDGTDTKRNNLTGSRQWFLSDRWFYFGALGAQQNEELGLELRVSATSGIGRYLRQTDKTEWALFTGLSVNKESDTGNSDANSSFSDSGANLELMLASEYVFYRLYSPKLRISIAPTVWQGITDFDRLRGNLNLSVQQEFISDLFWDLSFYYDYDSKPLPGALAKDDFGVVTSLGYEF